MNPNSSAAFPAFCRDTVHWTIQEFSPSALGNHRFTRHDSDKFTLTLSSGVETSWTLSLIRRQSCLSAYLTSHDLAADEIAVLNFRAGVESDDGEEFLWLCEGTVEEWHDHNRLGRLFNYQDLLKKLERFVGIAEGITIVVKLEVVASSKAPNLSLAILDHLEFLLENEQFGDFTMIASDGTEFRVNKALLAARSPVFQKMLAVDMLESQTNQAVIEDMTGPCLEAFLRFIYCGKSDQIDDFAVELLAAAEKYEVHDLKPLCEASLAQDITSENAVETLIIAHLHNAPTLKDFCIEYLVWNRLELSESDDWQHVPEKLFEEILDKTLEEPGEIGLVSNIQGDLLL